MPCQAQDASADPAALPLETAMIDDPCDEPAKQPAQGRGSWYLVWENDAVAVFSGSDEFYSQGIRLGYDFGTGRAPKPIKAQASWLCHHLTALNFGKESTRDSWSSGVFLGQHMFTPGRLSDTELIVDDRPYAGWLYLGERFSLRSEFEDHTNYHAVEVQLGVVGPQAQGKWAQTNFHALIHDETPMGWHNQLPFEPEIFANYRFMRLATLVDEKHPVEIDWMPGYEVGIGTLQDYVEPAVTLRLGRGLGEPPLSNLPARAPAMVASGNSTTPRRCSNGRGLFAIEECFIYGRVSGRYTAHNVFLDGTNWSDSHRVDRDPFYYDWAVGFRVRWKTMEMDYEFVRRSREFSPVPLTASNRKGRHDYGSVNVHCRDTSSWICPAFFTLLLGAVAVQ